MAVRNNNINTKITVDASGASKSTTKFFSDIRKGQNSVKKGGSGVDKSLKGTGIAAGKAGKSGAAGFGLFGKAMGAAKSSVLSMIPALGGLTAAIAATGIGAILIAVVALGAAFIGAVKKGAEFGKAISDLRAISGGTEKEIGILSKQAKQLGATTVFSASEVVLLQTELAKLGFTARNIQDATPSILDLAAALDVGLADAAAFAGAQINAFGLETTETKRIVDVMAFSAVNSAQDFTTLSESFAKAAPAAAALGVSVERTAAILGILADSNIKGSEAGTATKNSFIELTKKGIPLDDALNKIAGSSDKLLTAIELAGKRGGPALLVLANRKDDIAELTTEMEKAGEASEVAGQKFEGTANRIATIRNDNLQGDIKGLSSAWEGFVLSIEDGTGPLNELSRFLIQTLTNSIRNVTTAIQFFGFIWEETKDSVIKAGARLGTAGAGAFLILQGAVTKAVAKIKLAFSEVPILGAGIDVAAAEKNLAAANEVISKGFAKLRASAGGGEVEGSLMERFEKFQELELIASETKKKARDQEKADAEAAQKAAADFAKKQEADAKTLAKLQEKIKKQGEDLEDVTEEEKLQRKRERQLAELEDLAVSETAKKELVAEINQLYDDKADALAEEKRKEKEEKDAADAQLAADKQLEIDALELERVLTNDELTFDERLKLQEAYLDKKLANDLNNEKLTAEEIDLIQKKAQKAKDKVKKIEEKSSKELKDQVVNDALDGAAESFGIAQEVAVAKAIMSAPSAIAGSFENAAKVYAPPVSLAMGALGAAGVVVPIIKGLADIKKARFGKKGKSGGSSGGGGGGTISAPSGGGGAAGINPEAISDIAANNAARLGIDPSIGQAAGQGAANSVMGGSANRVVFSESAYSNFQDQVDFKESKTTID